MAAKNLRGNVVVEEIQVAVDEPDRTKWRPTSKEFQRYLVREVEMAKKNILASGPEHTLHSPMTITAAQKG